MSAFADRFSASQRTALEALGYAVLERGGGPGAPKAHPMEDDAIALDIVDSMGRSPGAALGAPGSAHAATTSSLDARPRSASARRDGAPRRGAAGGMLPASVLVVGMAAGDALADAVERALSSCVADDDARVRRRGGTLELAIGGQGPDWRVHLDQLRRSPAHKAALWRALRSLRRDAP